jgi:hypothetical protein
LPWELVPEKGGEHIMLKARIGSEIVIKVRNDVGVLSNLCKVIAEKGVNVLAVSAWVEDVNGIVHLLTDDNLRAVDALREKHYNPKEEHVVVTHAAHKPGMLRHITDKLAGAGIDIHHLYASAKPGDEECVVVFASANPDRAVVLLNE